MSNPLVPFAVTLAVAWGSVAFTGVMYALAVPPPAPHVVPTPPLPAPVPPAPTPPVTEVVVVTPPVGPVTPPVPTPPRPVNPTPPTPVPVPTPAPTPARGLPERVPWAAGELLVLVAPTPDQEQVWGGFAEEVAKLGPVKNRLVGGDVFVVGRGALWRWSDWVARGKTRPDEVTSAGETPDAAFARTFELVAADRQAVLAARGRSFRTAVVWHSPYAPAEPPAVRVPGTFLLWTGKEQNAQRDNAALPVVFPEPRSVYPLGPQVHDVGHTVTGLPPPAPNGAP